LRLKKRYPSTGMPLTEIRRHVRQPYDIRIPVCHMVVSVKVDKV